MSHYHFNKLSAIQCLYTTRSANATYVKYVSVDQNFLLIGLTESHFGFLYFYIGWSVAPEHNTMTLDNSKAIVLKVATLDTHLHCLTNPVNLKME